MIECNPISFGIFGPPAPVVDNAIAAFDGTTGRKIQSRAVTIDDSGNLVMGDGAWMGLGAGKGRMEFDDEAVDEINFLDCRVGIGTATPAEQLHVVDNIYTQSRVFVGQDGSVGTPALVHRGESTGIYFPATNNIGFVTNNSEEMRIDTDGNIGIGATTFGTNAAGTMAFLLGTDPITDIANQFALWGKDQAVGNTAPAIRTENGAVIHLFQALKANYNNWANFSDIVDALVAIGLFDLA